MQNTEGKTALGLDANVGAMICYIPICLIGIIYSIIVIVQDKTNKLARFHAFQSLLLLAVAFVIGFGFAIIMAIFSAITNSMIIGLLGTLINIVIGLGILLALIFCAIKAFQGDVFKLPVIGDMADKWSN